MTRSPLELVPAETLARLNVLIEAGSLRTVDGVVVRNPLEAALMTVDRRVAYPVADGIPVLLEEHGFLLSQLD